MDLLASATWPLGAVVALALDAASPPPPPPPAEAAPPASARVSGSPHATLHEHLAMQVACLPRLLLAHLAYTQLLGADWRAQARVLRAAWVGAILLRYVLLCWTVGLVTDGLHLWRGSPFRASMARHKFNAAYPALLWRGSSGTSPVLRDAALSTLSAALAGLLEAGALHYCAGGAGRCAADDDAGWWRHAPTVALMLSWFYSQNIQFWCLHRTLHRWGTTPDVGAWLYRHVHSWHHAAKSPTAFSGVAMHPLEALLYLSYGLFPLLFGAHPVAVIYLLTNLIAAAMLGHDGFEAPAQGSAPHHIHHAMVDCNYAEAHLPIDWLMGTFARTAAEAEVLRERRLGGGGGERAKKAA